MLSTTLSLLIKSHQTHGTGHPLAGKRYGRSNTRHAVSYGGYGWGISFFVQPKDRTFKPMRFNGPATLEGHTAQSTTTKTLSAHFRPFALADGGVLIVHPSQKQIMSWTHDVLGREQAASGLGDVHAATRSKIQALVSGSAVENVSVSHWRQKHIERLLRKHTGS
jgi:hypothetical protein